MHKSAFSDASYRGITHRRYSKGFTLTEIAVTLGIIGIVLGGIWTASAAAYTALNATKTANQIQTVINNIGRLYYPNIPLSDPDFQNGMINAGVVPVDMINQSSGGTTITTALGGNVILSASSSGLSRQFDVTFQNFTTEKCMKFFPALTQSGSSSSSYAMTLAATGCTSSSCSSARAGIPIDLSTASVTDVSGVCNYLGTAYQLQITLL